MKKTTFTLFSFYILFLVSTVSAYAQSEETRHISVFNRIVSEGPFDVYVKMDGDESLKIASGLDIIKLIETNVLNGILTIKYKDNLKSGEGNSDSPINIYVGTKSLTAISNTSSGSIKIDGVLTGRDVKINLGDPAR